MVFNLDMSADDMLSMIANVHRYSMVRNVSEESHQRKCNSIHTSRWNEPNTAASIMLGLKMTYDDFLGTVHK